MQYHLLPYIEQVAVHKNTFGASWRDSNNGGRSNTVIKVYISPLDHTLMGDNLATDWGNRGQVSYNPNWHAFGGGWDEDWQIGGKARIPRNFPDGTSNVIAFVERYARCGPGSAADWNSYRYVSRIWAEDGEPLSGPISTCYQDTSHEAPTYWIPMLPNSACGGNRRGYPNMARRPLDYPIETRPGLATTGLSRYMTAIQVTPTVAECDPTRLQAMTAGGMLVVLMDGSVRSVNPSISTHTLARAFVPDDGQPLGTDWNN
jgi:hypothetical protein